MASRAHRNSQHDNTPVIAPNHSLEVRSASLRLVSGLCISVAYLVGMSVMVRHHPMMRWDLLCAPALVGTGAVGVLCLRWPERFRALLLLSMLFAAAILASVTSSEPQGDQLFALVCLTAGMLLSPIAALGAAALGTVAIYALSRIPGTESIWADVAVLWLTFAIVWSATRELYAALDRARADEAYAWGCANEARLHRGELARTQKSLNEMYDLLQRTNHELATARFAAEEARNIKAQFAANVSHELRTPLNLILGFSEMMYQSPEVYGDVRWTPALRADVREIHRSARHLLGMVDDILDLSRIDVQRLPLKLELADLAEIIADAVATARPLLDGTGIQLLERIPAELPRALVDRARIRQVLLNLLNNAVRCTDHGRIDVTAEEQDGEVIIEVSDTGVGIPPEDLEIIFEEFGQARGPVTRGRGGVGLGLAICKRFVRLHGGQISVTSEAGKGSVFRFSIPLPDSGRSYPELSVYAPAGWSARIPENPLAKAVVVLDPGAEGSSMIAQAIPGYRALTVHSVDELATIVEAEHPAGIVTVLDTGLDNLLESSDLWSHAQRADLPIISCVLPPDASMPHELGVAAYMVKPIQCEQLIATVRAVSAAPRSVLVVDDDPGFVSLTERFLVAAFQDVELRKAYSGEQALGILAKQAFDVILLDLVMPEVDGLDVINAMRAAKQDNGTQIIVVTGSGYEESRHWGSGMAQILSTGWSRDTYGRCISALLDVSPPDYSLAAPAAQQISSRDETPAS